MIKIFHLLPTLNCDSGITSLIMNYYRKIDKTKFIFYFIYFLDSDANNYEKEIESLGGICIKVSSPKKILKFRNDLKSIFESEKNNNNMIFHNHLINFTVLINGIIKKYFKNKIIIHNHQTKYSDRVISSIRNRIMCIPLKFYRYNFFACSEDAGKLIFGKKNYYILNNGIDINKYKFDENSRQKYRDEFGFTNDNIVIGHVGRLEYAKNHEFIIEVFSKLVEKDTKYKLLLVGNGRLKEKIINLSKEKNIFNNITFLDARIDIPEILNCMDLFIFPSIFEGLGIVAVEAQASGLPIIMSDSVPAITRINNYSSLSLSDDIGKWIDQIEKMIETSDVNSRVESNEILYNSVFNINENVRELEKKYLEIINN